MLDSRPMSVRHITNPFIPACNSNNHLQPSLTQTAILPAHPHIFRLVFNTPTTCDSYIPHRTRPQLSKPGISNSYIHPYEARPPACLSVSFGRQALLSVATATLGRDTPARVQASRTVVISSGEK